MNEASDITADNAPQPEALDEDALRRRLINRIALAGVAIVALLGGLAIIDTVYVSPPPMPVKAVATQPIAEAVRLDNGTSLSSVSAPVGKPVPAPEAPKPEAIPTIKSSGEPEESYSPSIPLPKQPPPVVAEPRTVPALAGPPMHTPTAPPQGTPNVAGVQGPRPFVLQMGVFNNVDNAQELLARLQKNGLPAQIEARVQVGPFTTKAEADAARAKLKAMGLDPGLLMSAHR
jgi:DedD protein